MRAARALGVVAVITAAWAAPARADDAATARDAYAKGMAHYHLEEYDAAIEEWERGFRAKPAPEFLYNIGQAYRLSKRPDKALSFYQKYLRVAPDAANREEVERHMQALQELIDKQKAQQGNEPPPAPAPQPAPPPPPIAPAPSGRADLVARPAERPVYKKGWFWGVIGGAAVVVAGGVVLGVVLGTHSGVQTLPDARL